MTKLDCDCGREPGKHTKLSCGVPIPEHAEPKAATRYVIVGDDSGHDYYIPADRSGDWNRWLERGEDDEPKYATRIDGRFTFADPRCE